MKKLFTLTVVILFTIVIKAQVSIISYGSTWKYLANGTNQGTAWRASAFIDAAWPSGPAQLGYGDGDEATVVPYGPNASKKYITTYFRISVPIANASLYSSFTLNVKRDDGAVVYINGTERFRTNMPTGTISYTTKAASNAADNGNTAQTINLPAGTLISGTNVIAVEVHQRSATSSDLSFDLQLTGTGDVTPPTVSTYSPADNATGVSANSNLVLTFSENIQKGTGNILIKEGGVTKQTIDVTDASVTISGNTVTINPASDFALGAAVNIEIAPGTFKDLTGNNYDGIVDATTWNFSVIPPDVTPPTVTTLSPLDNATGVSASANLVLTFSENVQKGTGNILIKEGGVTTQTIDVSSATVIVSGNTVTIDPANFTYNAAVNVEIPAGAFKDLANNLYTGITNSTTWNFTVENPDLVAPTVTTYTPADNATGVLATANLALTFSENVQKGTGNILIKEGGVTTQTINVTSASVTVSGNTVTIDPANFTYSAAVNVEIATGAIKDFSNNNYAGIADATSWNFSIETAPSGPQTLVAYGATWKYLDNGTNQGTAWRGTGFNDGTWASGPGQLGYGDGDEATVVSYGPDANNKYITTYFRKTISIADPTIFSSIAGSVFRDDGIAIYINGTEVYRNTLAAGALYNTFATAAVSDDGATAQTFSFSPSVFVSGNNVIAVEIHQSAVTSSDISFDLQLIGNTGSPAASLTRGPYMNMGNQSAVTLRWRTDIATNSRVEVGTVHGVYPIVFNDATSVTEHQLRLTGLDPDTKYYYRFGSSTQALQAGTDNYFMTAPPANTTRKLRFAVFGDCGRNDNGYQPQTLAAYQNYLGTNAGEIMILLGDNAYTNGTDAEYQTGFFTPYQSSILKNHIVMPAPGNHDYYSTNQASRTGAYYQNFTMPTAGECGGVSSGTEAYYSWDRGDVHFISLDSYGTESPNATRLYNVTGPQVTWLQQDLAANTKKWTIVYWHHPPYTMGSHNSDTETELVNIRTNLLSILESYGVDLVMCGHSHDYERSYLLKGYIGNEASFNTGTHAVNNSSAKYNGTANSCPYNLANGQVNHGTVYVVSGSSGASGGTQAGYPHNALPWAYNDGGMLYLEIEGNRLDAKFIRRDQVIADQFTIMKDVNKTTNLSIPSGTPTDISASWIGNYSWSTGAITKKITVSPTTNTTYTVTDGAGCINDVINITVTGGNARYPQINTNPETSSVTGLKVMPTLAYRGQQVVVQLAERQKTHASVIDISGKVLQTFDFYQTYYIPTVKLKPGIYFIRFDGKFRSATQKFVIIE